MSKQGIKKGARLHCKKKHTIRHNGAKGGKIWSHKNGSDLHDLNIDRWGRQQTIPQPTPQPAQNGGGKSKEVGGGIEEAENKYD